MDYDLLIDLGTGSTRAALVDSGGGILSMRSFSNRYYRDEAYPDAQFFLPGESPARASSCWTAKGKPFTDCPTSTTAAGSSWRTSARRI